MKPLVRVLTAPSTSFACCLLLYSTTILIEPLSLSSYHQHKKPFNQQLDSGQEQCQPISLSTATETGRQCPPYRLSILTGFPQLLSFLTLSQGSSLLLLPHTCCVWKERGRSEDRHNCVRHLMNSIGYRFAVLSQHHLRSSTSWLS